MTPREAKEKLLLYRPGVDDPRGQEFAQAFTLAEKDEDLKRWFEEHCAFQSALRKRFRELQPPDELKAKLLAKNIVPLPAWWRRKEILAAAALAILLIAVASLWFTPANVNTFHDYRAKMVSTVLREYRMDVASNDMEQVRQYMAQRGSPSDYRLRGGMEQLALAGGGFLRWRNNPVSMVCFRRPDNEMMYLFVLKKDVLENNPPSTPAVQEINGVATASWTEEDKTYVFAGPPESDFVSRYLAD